MYKHEWKIVKPNLFPNDEIFLCTCDILKEKAVWGVPEFLISSFQEYFNGYSHDKLLDSALIWEHARWLNDQVHFNLPVIQCRLSITYSLNKNSKPNVVNTNAVWKKELDEQTIDMNHKGNAFYVGCIKEYQFCSFIQEGADIASIAFCTDNGAHTVETQRKYRNRGYGTAVLQLLIKKTNEAGINLVHATDSINIASCRVAEKCGFEVNKYMYWITIPPYARSSIPDFINKDLNVLSFPGHK